MDVEERIIRTQRELELLRHERVEANLQHREELERLQRRQDRCAAMQRNMAGANLHVYMNAIKVYHQQKGAPPVPSPYISRQEAMLCQVLHRMATVDSAHKEVKKARERSNDHYNEEIKNYVEHSSASVATLISKINELSDELEALQYENQLVLYRQQKELKELRRGFDDSWATTDTLEDSLSLSGVFYESKPRGNMEEGSDDEQKFQKSFVKSIGRIKMWMKKHGNDAGGNHQTASIVPKSPPPAAFQIRRTPVAA